MGKQDSAKNLEAAWKNSLKKNKCLYGCDIDKNSCEHLEAYLNMTTDVVSENHNITYVEDIDAVAANIIGIDNFGYVHAYTEEQLNEFVQGLVAYGLSEHEVQLIVERLINNKTWKELCEDTGWVKIHEARKYLQKAVSKLRLRGFKPKRIGQ